MTDQAITAKKCPECGEAMVLAGDLQSTTGMNAICDRCFPVVCTRLANQLWTAVVRVSASEHTGLRIISVEESEPVGGVYHVVFTPEKVCGCAPEEGKGK